MAWWPCGAIWDHRSWSTWLAQVMTWCLIAPSCNLKQCLLIISETIKGYGLTQLWPIDAIWQYRTGSTLAQVMAWCRQATSHYLNQYWLITSKDHWQSCGGNFIRNTSTINHWDYLKIVQPKFHSNLPGANEQWGYISVMASEITSNSTMKS